MLIKKNRANRLQQFAMAAALGLSTIALTACAPSQRVVTGDKVGHLVVIADNTVQSNVLMSVNGQYFNTLASQRKFEQAICVGEYTVQASSSQVKMPEPSHSVVRKETQAKVKINKGQTTYLQVSQTAKGWVLAPATEQAIKSVQNYTEKNGKLVRRLPDYMINCK